MGLRRGDAEEDERGVGWGRENEPRTTGGDVSSEPRDRGWDRARGCFETGVHGARRGRHAFVGFQAARGQGAQIRFSCYLGVHHVYFRVHLRRVEGCVHRGGAV